MKNDAINKSNRKFLDTFPLCHEVCHRNIIYTLWIFLILYPFHQYYYFQFEFTKWDPLLFTGVMAFILGLNLTVTLNQRFKITLKRLLIRKIIKLEGEEKNIFSIKLEEHAQYCARIGGIVVAIIILVAFSVILINNFSWQQALLGRAESFGGYIAGTYLGRMVSYGQLGWQLQKQSIEVQSAPLTR